MFKLVTFDVTGTLLFFQTPIFEKYIQAGLKFGIKADAEVIKKNFKDAWRILNAEHPNFGREGLGWQEWWIQFVEKTFGSYIKPEEKNKALQIAEDLIAFHTTKNAFKVRPGTEDLLEYLKLKSVSLGVISNYDPRLHKILELVKLRKYFDFVLTSYEFGFAKPDRRIFEEALRLGGCSSSEEAIHIGDDFDVDFRGAAQAGMKAVWICPELKGQTRDDGNVCEDFFQLKNYFEAFHNEKK